MDPLSITASVIALIQVTNKIVSICKDFITTVQDTPSGLQVIVIEIGSLECVLDVLELLLSNRKSSNQPNIVEKLKSADGPLHGCMQALQQLEKLLPTYEPCKNRGKRRKISTSLTNLAWPLKEGKARKLLEEIGRHKAILSLALTVDNFHNVNEISANVDKIRDTLNDGQRANILDWLVTTDPSSNHNTALGLHEPLTSSWLLRSSEYKDWREGSSRLLWMHGIPGAGKTILTSFIIEDVRAFCKDSSKHLGWAFYYCYHQRNQDESVHFLRWITNQLCRQSGYVPPLISDAYSSGVKPSSNELITALAVILPLFSHSYVIIDALDESADRFKLLRILDQLASDDRFQNLSILAASRKEHDIERSLQSYCTGLSLSNELVDEDINTYISCQLIDQKKFGRWSSALKKDVESALVKGSKGMFRWAYCQLDILSRLRPSEIIPALAELPETLDDTYERILTAIPIKTRNLAHKALQLLAFDFKYISLDVLARTVVVDDEQCSFNTDNHFFHPEDLLEICTCLLTYQRGASPEVQLSHYTVKEYLTSVRVKPPDFWMSDKIASILTAKCSLIYLIHGDFIHEKYLSDEEYMFMRHHQTYWPVYSRKVEADGGDVIVSGLVLKFLDPSGLHFDYWAERTNIPVASNPQSIIASSEAGLSFTLALVCWFDLPDAAKVLMSRVKNFSILESRVKQRFQPRLGYYPTFKESEGTPLQIAFSNGNAQLIEFLISLGANTNAAVDGASTILILAIETSARITPYYKNNLNEIGEGEFIINKHRVLQLLLDGGANVNPTGVARTPLQASVQGEFDLSTAKKLLDAGADVNGVGEYTGVIREAIDRSAYFRSHGYDHEAITKNSIQSSGYKSYFDTPLRIAENLPEIYNNECMVDKNNELRELLKAYGGESYHLFPFKDLPGYNKADMNSFLAKQRKAVECENEDLPEPEP